jgi:hypothetical protein
VSDRVTRGQRLFDDKENLFRSIIAVVNIDRFPSKWLHFSKPPHQWVNIVFEASPMSERFLSWDPNDPFTGILNIFTFPAVTCIDVSYANIDTAQSFTNYIYNQIQQNPFVGELSGSFASCLGWPNLTAYNAETIYAGNYPSKLANQMLVIGVMDDPVCPYPGALETYEFVGDENASFLVHEGWDIVPLLIPITALPTCSPLTFSMVRIFWFAS